MTLEMSGEIKEFVLEGNKFDNLQGFYDEVERVLTKDLGWKIGRNLDAFNDVLGGGFGAFEYEEPIHIIWGHSDKSKSDLGYPETIKWLEEKLKQCQLLSLSLRKQNSVIESANRALGLSSPLQKSRQA